MTESRHKKGGQQHQRDWSSQQQIPGQQHRQKGGAGREDIDDSDQAVDSAAGISDDSGMLGQGGESGGGDRPKEN